MSNPTDLGEIVVNGQRRPNGSSSPFPSLPSPGVVLPTPEIIKDPNGGGGPSPCSVPARKREWNMDATAASAVSAFLADALSAGEANLEFRERGAYILRNPNGTYSLGPIARGSTFAPSGSSHQPITTLDPTLVGDMSRIVGLIHNHNVGQHLPSAPSGNYPGDQGGMQTLQNIMNTYSAGSGSKARMYIIAKAADGSYKTSVYSPTTIQYDENGNPPPIGPEVNPNAQNCPA